MGIGVEPDATFAGRLAAQIDTAQVLNPSLIGYSSRDYRKVLAVLFDTAAAVTVRRATVFWCLNDVYAGSPELSDPDQAVRRVGGRLLTFVRQHFRTYQWLKALLFDRPRTYYEHDRALYAGAPFDAAVDDLLQMQALAAGRGLRFEVVLLPYEYQLRRATDADVFEPQRRLRERLAGAGIPVYDAAPYLLAHTDEPSTLYLYGDGIHFSEDGHRLVTAFVAEQIR